jgi:hypothetical protein
MLYAAQHPGPPAKPISVWFALVGLHLALVQGRTGRQVQRAHMQLGRHKQAWPPLRPPADLRCTTAGNVIRQFPGDDRDAAIVAGWDDLARVLPSAAMYGMFTPNSATFTAGPATAVFFGYVAALLTVTGVLFTRRDTSGGGR